MRKARTPLWQWFDFDSPLHFHAYNICMSNITILGIAGVVLHAVGAH